MEIEKEPKIAYCQCTYQADYQDTLECVRDVSKYVDHVIIIEDGTLTYEQRKALMEINRNVEVITVKFNDDLPAFRNNYLQRAKELRVDYCLVSDPDEHFNEYFLKNLRSYVKEMEKLGKNIAGIRCDEAFDVQEWTDNLDELKEYPGGIRQSNYYKNLLFKLYPDLEYVGVGKGNVHETWNSRTVPWNPVNLPPAAAYVHRKSTLRIFRNAARNLFMGGGGDNVKDLNEMWVELRKICDDMGIKTWYIFEKYITSQYELSKDLIDWVKRALVWKANDYGTETRETAKWICWYHRELLNDPDIAYGLKNPPKMTERDEIEAFVRREYFRVLGRHPDRNGLEYYTNLILSKNLQKEQLGAVLMASDEYKAKFPHENVRIQLPVNVDISLTEENLTQALMQSKTYWNTIKPRLDLAKAIEKMLVDVPGFYDEFYEIQLHEATMSPALLLELLKKYSQGS
jgi:hypothetical protein